MNRAIVDRWMASISGEARLALFMADPGEHYDASLETRGVGYPAGGKSLGHGQVRRDTDGWFLTYPTPTVFEDVTLRAEYAVVYLAGDGLVLRSERIPEGDREARNGPFTVTLPVDVLRVRV